MTEMTPLALAPETLAELRRLYEAAFTVGAPENEWEEWTSKAAEAFPALLDAAAERDALTVAQPCVMRMGEVYDFAWCEAHDRTFALGSSCDHAGLSHVDYLDEDGRRQRGRAVLAEMEMERIAAERDALAAKVAALADWHETKAEKARRFRIEIGGRNPVMDKAAEVHTDAARRLRAALDEEPQP